jgi:hypothetical protein
MTFTFNLEQPDGSPADPPTYGSTVLVWNHGDVIPLGADRGSAADRTPQPIRSTSSTMIPSGPRT